MRWEIIILDGIYLQFTHFLLCLTKAAQREPWAWHGNLKLKVLSEYRYFWLKAQVRLLQMNSGWHLLTVCWGHIKHTYASIWLLVDLNQVPEMQIQGHKMSRTESHAGGHLKGTSQLSKITAGSLDQGSETPTLWFSVCVGLSTPHCVYTTQTVLLSMCVDFLSFGLNCSLSDGVAGSEVHCDVFGGELWCLQYGMMMLFHLLFLNWHSISFCTRISKISMHTSGKCLGTSVTPF